MKVRFCEHNKGKSKVVNRLRENFPRLDVKVKDCIKKCGPCHKSLFAVVNGKTFCALEAEDLYRKIVAEMDEARGKR